MNKKLIWGVAVAVVVIGACVAYSSLFPGERRYQNCSQEKCAPDTISKDTNNPMTSDWKTYSNKKYGFEFKYPTHLSNPVETSGQVEKMDCSSKAYGEISIAHISGVAIGLACSTNAKDYQYKESPQIISVAGRNSLSYDYTSATGYHNHEVYIPLNNNLYISISSSSKSGQTDGVISPEDFEKILSTFKFTAH